MLRKRSDKQCPQYRVFGIFGHLVKFWTPSGCTNYQVVLHFCYTTIILCIFGNQHYTTNTIQLLHIFGNCYDHVQLRVLSGYSGRVAAL